MDLENETWSVAFPAVITKPTPSSNVAAGFELQDGAGTGLGVKLSSNGIGPLNGGGFTSYLGTVASSDRNIVIADAAGYLCPEQIAILAADVTNSTITPSAIASFGITLEISSQYEFEILLRVQSAAVGTGYQFQLTGPSAQTDWLVYEAEFMLGTALATPSINRVTLTSFASVVAPTAAATANTDFFVKLRGMMKTTASTPGSQIGISFNSEVAASTVTTKAGSIMRFRKLKLS